LKKMLEGSIVNDESSIQANKQFSGKSVKTTQR